MTKKITNLNELGFMKGHRVLAIMPHPDDEAIFAAHLLSDLSEMGVTVRLIVKSGGEQSTLRFGLDEKTDLKKVRILEQTRAAQILKVESHKIYDFGDGQLHLKEAEIKAQLQIEYQEFKPTHLITLEPHGIYGHSDHVALSRYVKETRPPNARILYATVHEKFKAGESSLKMSVVKKLNPAKPDFIYEVSFLRIIHKLKVLQAHRSQFGFLNENLPSFIHILKEQLLHNEYFAWEK